MNKVFLVCAIVCAGQLYGMEKTYELCSNVSSTVYSYISSWFTPQEYFGGPKEAEYVKTLRDTLRENKHNFEQKISLSHTERYWIGMDYVEFFHFPGLFFKVCYYLENYLEYHNTLPSLDKIPTPLLEKLQARQIDGYSAIGAAIIAPNVSIEDKRKFIEQLINFGFKLTEKDIQLAELELYDAIPTDKKTDIILVLSRNDMPYDVRNEIVGCMIQKYKETLWPLPEIASYKK